jgi:hypothetical protein
MFQRVTGPTYPKNGSVQMDSGSVDYELLRSYDTGSDLPVRIEVGPDIRGSLVWRRYPTEEPWGTVTMTREAGVLTAAIDSQPPAGKVEYQIVLESASGERRAVPDDEPAVARFKGPVPTAILAPHVLAMFLSMLLATRALLEVLRRQPRPNIQVIVTMILLFGGGLILGPIVQKYAFGSYWTGWPFGKDFTDNKTFVAFLAWLPATILAFRLRFWPSGDAARVER